jgi:hypothetical protein
MFYVLEFFREDEAGEKHRLQSFGYETPSEDLVIRYAGAYLRNVTVQDEIPTVCLVKSIGGKVISVVSAQSPTTQDARQEVS